MNESMSLALTLLVWAMTIMVILMGAAVAKILFTIIL
jgi:hypothetical protein